MRFIKIAISTFVLILTVFSGRSDVHAQISVKTSIELGNYNAEDLVTNILLSGGLNISNVQYNGSSLPIECTSIGAFETGNTPTNLGIERGIIMSSGGIEGVLPQNGGQETTNHYNCLEYNDPALAQIVGLSTNDVAVLEFDFVPWADTVTFNYVFASNEYEEYVNSQYNDAFGFFITGQNPAGGYYNDYNVALIPGTNTPVTINNVNHLLNSEYYTNNYSHATIGYDGFTHKFTAFAVLVPFTTYHFRFSICDVSDSALDSAVFLEANSFETNFDMSYSINGVPYVDIPAGQTYCTNSELIFSTIANCEYSSSKWYFGDGTTDFGDTVAHHYAEAGTYEVMNVIYDPHRAQDSMYFVGNIEVQNASLFISDSTCSGSGYHKHGFDLDNLPAGWHYDTITVSTMSSCDSTIYLELFVTPSLDTTFYDTVCFGNGYHEHGFEIDSLDLEIGVNYDTLFLQTALGCDSIVYLELYVAPIYDTTFYDTICRNESYNEHGFALDSLPVGWHFDTINPGTILGCDSIVYLELFVAPIYDTTFYDTICRNESYNEHGFALDSLPVGWHFDTINPGTVLGCDSIVYLELYVAPIYDTTFIDTVCFGNGYHEHGFEIDSLDLEIGMNYDTLHLQTVIGCDSIVYLELLVGDLFDISLTDTTCVNEGYHKYGFDLDSLELGWRYDTLFLSSIAGCDSTVTLELYVAPVFDTTFFDTICSGNNYFEHGFSIQSPNVGWNFDTLGLSTTLGCDSLVYLELYVAPTYDIVLFDSICFGEDYHLHGFDFESPGVGDHSETHESVTTLGCDSIVVMNLFVGEVYDIKLHDTVCFGDNYDNYNFHFVNPPLGTNSETQALNSMYGCDSTVNLKLYVAPVYRFTVYDSICEGDDYTSYGLFIPQPKPGMHSHTSILKTELGCDSIFDVNFKVIYTYKTPDTIYGLGSVYVSTDLLPGKYRYWIDTITGCNDYYWEIDNDKWIMYPDRNECTIIVTTPEVTTLTVRAGNSCGEVSKSIEIHAGYFGVDENETVKADVYPNPSDGIVNVVADGIEAVNILNATGAVVKSCKFEKENLVSIDISDMPNSIYVLEIVTRDGRCIRRITKAGY